MIIAHLPAGYIAARTARHLGAPQAMFIGILVGSFAPDFDMLWFAFVDHGSTHHHSYLTHRPALWAVILALGIALRSAPITGFGIGTLLHVALDSIAGRVNWGWPLADLPVTLIHVPATQPHWLLSFIFHWTFAVELLVTLFAGILWASANLRRGRSR